MIMEEEEGDPRSPQGEDKEEEMGEFLILWFLQLQYVSLISRMARGRRVAVCLLCFSSPRSCPSNSAFPYSLFGSPAKH